MLRKQFTIGAAILLCFFMVGTAWAIPITLKEVFLGGKSNFFSMAEKSVAQNVPGTGNKARFNFDLTGSGGAAQLLLGNKKIGAMQDPTRDETGYDPLVYQTPYLAYVDFFISDWEYIPASPPTEKVRINIETGSIVQNKIYTLENDPDGSKRFRVDLVSENMLGLLSDGELMAMTIAPGFGDVFNTFVLDRVILYAEAVPVPEPGTILLLGSGLLGMAAIQRRRIRKK